MKNAGWLTLIVMSLAAFIIAFDTTFMNVAIINLVQDLNTTVGTIQAIITIYALTMASLMLIGAKMQDIIGRRKTFILGSVLYGLGALLATFSFNGLMLLVGWSFMEGIGAALMMPATVSIITGTYMGNRRVFAFGLWTGVTAIAAAVGPFLGGFLTTFLSWRYGFAMEVFIVLAMIISSTKLLEFPPTITWKDLDIWGSFLPALGIFLVVLGILQLNNLKNWYLVPYLLLIGMILLLAFYFWQQRRIKQEKTPLVDINLLKIRVFSAGTIIRLMANMGMAGIIFIIPVFLESVTDANAFVTGLALLPLTMSLLIFSLWANRISHYIKPTYLISLGFLITIIGCLTLRNTFTLETTLLNLVPGIVLVGVGVGLLSPLSVDMVLASAGNKQSDASGVVNTVGNTGWAIGTALIGVIVLIGVYGGLATAVEDQLPGKYSPSEINQNLPVWVDKLQTTDLAGFRGPDKTVVGRIVDETIARAMNTVFDWLALFFFLGLISSVFMWKGK